MCKYITGILQPVRYAILFYPWPDTYSPNYHFYVVGADSMSRLFGRVLFEHLCRDVCFLCCIYVCDL